AGRDLRRDRSVGGRDRARENSIAAARPPLRGGRADGGADPSSRGAEPGMIRYTLACDKGHQFESWFPNSSAYDKQVKRKLVTCPDCGSAKVEKAIMAPRLKRTDKRMSLPEPIEAPAPAAAPVTAPSPAAAPAPDATPVAMMSPQEKELRSKLKELRDHLVKN